MAGTEKTDLYKLHKAEYVAPKEPALVEVKPAHYLTVCGQGAPGGEVFQARVGALYGVAYTIKMTSKAAGRDYVVCKLEGQWWADDNTADLSNVPQDQWRWKLFIRTPEFVGENEIRHAIDTLLERGKTPEVSEVVIETIDEGLCVQMLHVGPYDKEHETIEAMEQFMLSENLVRSGLHHEIYLSDPRRIPPERLRTIIRLPVTALAPEGS